MRIVVADTGPLNYLVLIGQVNLLPALFEKVIVPTVVYRELTSPRAPIPQAVYRYCFSQATIMWRKSLNVTSAGSSFSAAQSAGRSN